MLWEMLRLSRTKLLSVERKDELDNKVDMIEKEFDLFTK